MPPPFTTFFPAHDTALNRLSESYPILTCQRLSPLQFPQESNRQRRMSSQSEQPLPKPSSSKSTSRNPIRRDQHPQHLTHRKPTITHPIQAAAASASSSSPSSGSSLQSELKSKADTKTKRISSSWLLPALLSGSFAALNGVFAKLYIPILPHHHPATLTYLQNNHIHNIPNIHTPQ